MCVLCLNSAACEWTLLFLFQMRIISCKDVLHVLVRIIHCTPNTCFVTCAGLCDTTIMKWLTRCITSHACETNGQIVLCVSSAGPLSCCGAMSASSDGGSNDEEPAHDGWNMGATWDAEVGCHSATASSSTSKFAAAVIQEDCIQQEPEFELQQHADNVYLERFGQQCKVGHLSTLEKVDIPVGPSTWELEFHKGLGAIEAEDGQVLYI